MRPCDKRKKVWKGKGFETLLLKKESMERKGFETCD